MTKTNKSLFIRSKNNPVLKPNSANSWESLKVYNCGAIFENGKYHIYYRAVGKGKNWQSTIGHAVSEDGEKFIRLEKPALSPTEALELRGLEDPRITKIENRYYMAYAAYDGKTPRLCNAVSEDLITWKKNGPVFKSWNFEKAGGKFISWRQGQPIIKRKKAEWSKSGGIFPEKIDGQYWMLFGEYRIWFAVSNDLTNWQVLPGVFLGPRANVDFDNTYVEMGPPPIKTEKGWLVLYHGIDDKIFYHLGFILLDINNPQKIIFRSNTPIFSPRESYELSGLVDILPGGVNGLQKLSKTELDIYIKKAEREGFMPKVTFCCGAVVVNDILRIYYGAADTVVCTATAKLADILKLIDD